MLLWAQSERLSAACGEGHLLFLHQSRDKRLLTACQDHREALPQLVGSFEECEGPPSRGSSETHPSRDRRLHEHLEKSLRFIAEPRRSSSWAPRNTWGS